MIFSMEQEKKEELERISGLIAEVLASPATPETCQRVYELSREYSRALGKFDLFNPPLELRPYIERGAELVGAYLEYSTNSSP